MSFRLAFTAPGTQQFRKSIEVIAESSERAWLLVQRERQCPLVLWTADSSHVAWFRVEIKRRSFKQTTVPQNQRIAVNLRRLHDKLRGCKRWETLQLTDRQVRIGDKTLPLDVAADLEPLPDEVPRPHPPPRQVRCAAVACDVFSLIFLESAVSALQVVFTVDAAGQLTVRSPEDEHHPEVRYELAIPVPRPRVVNSGPLISKSLKFVAHLFRAHDAEVELSLFAQHGVRFTFHSRFQKHVVDVLPYVGPWGIEVDAAARQFALRLV